MGMDLVRGRTADDYTHRRDGNWDADGLRGSERAAAARIGSCLGGSARTQPAGAGADTLTWASNSKPSARCCGAHVCIAAMRTRCRCETYQSARRLLSV